MGSALKGGSPPESRRRLAGVIWPRERVGQSLAVLALAGIHLRASIPV